MAYRFINIGVLGIEENIWKLNPQLPYTQPFKKLYDQDKSKDHEASSKDLWCVWMLEDPSYQNKVFQLEPTLKMETIMNYHPGFKVEDALILEIRQVYPELCLSISARAFALETGTFVDRSEIFKGNKYTLDSYETDPKTSRTKLVKGTASELDAIRGRTLKIFENYKKVEAMFEEEQAGSRVQGSGREETHRERGLLPTNVKEDYE